MTSRKPYYEDGLVTLYLGDCMEVLSELGQFEMVFTSPPYNLGTTTGGGFGHYSPDARMTTGGNGSRGGKGKWVRAATAGGLTDGYEDHGDALPMPEYEAWQQSCLALMWEHCTGAIFYNHKPRPMGELWLPLRCNPGLPLRQIITWSRAGGINFAPTHYVPTYEWIMVFARPDWRLKSKAASGVGDVWREPQEPSEHPAPFPVGLPARAIESVRPASVLDPFAGSGSTLVAARAAGVPAVGIEKSERYAEMAVKRLAQGSLFGTAS